MLLAYGFHEIDTHKGKSVYWASERMLDETKFNKCLSHADPDDYVVDKIACGKLTKDNTHPVVIVIERKKMEEF